MGIVAEVLIGLMCLAGLLEVAGCRPSVDWSSMDNDPEMNIGLEDDDV